MKTFSSQDIIKLFNQLFQDSENTLLLSGGKEPVYLPKTETKTAYHHIIFTENYFASALHEIAHWCIAGQERRKLIDYGYWYQPDGRNNQQQLLFQKAECKPQALEWIFSVAAGSPFYISQDNINYINNINHYKFALTQQAKNYLQTGLPPRAEKFKQALLHYYNKNLIFDADLFNAELLK